MSNYKNMILDLLPNGEAWNKSSDSNLSKLSSGLAWVFERLHQRMQDLVSESDPRLTSEMLGEWEKMVNLPDNCTPGDRTSIERKAQILQRLTFQGGQSAQYYEGLIRSLGFEAEIIEHDAFRAGKSRAGDALTNNSSWRHTWTVKIPGSFSYKFRAGIGRAGEPLEVTRNSTVECIVNRLRPAHTRVIFSFITGE
jgi:uncharacterized protein YmfQ (DUF2313 family)